LNEGRPVKNTECKKGGRKGEAVDVKTGPSKRSSAETRAL